MTNVFVNNQSCSLPAGTNLLVALEKSGVTSQRGVAVAVNNCVIPKTAWHQKVLNENDRITIIKATQGG